MFTIYMITNQKNNKRYVGFTSKTAQDRFNEHMSGYGGSRLLWAAVQKYGPTSFSFTVLEQHQDLDHALQVLEPFYIKEKMSHCKEGHGYNISFGGTPTVLGRKHTDACKARMSQARLGKPRPASYGKKMSQILKGRPKSEEHKKKLSIANTGKKFSDERRRKHSDALKGHKKSSNQTYLVSNKRNEYLITFPDGRRETITGLSEFCKAHDLSQSSMSRVHLGLQEHHRGFQCEKLK